MKTKFKTYFAIYISVLFFACTKDIIVTDIKNKTITINAPVDNLRTSTNLINFWWENLDGVEKYNLQIVSPGFDSVAQLIVDTNVTVNKFNWSLTPGKYQWRIKGMNSGGSTKYITRNIVVDKTNDLNFLTVTPVSPANNYLTGKKVINFSWDPLTAANYYNIVIQNASGGTIRDTNTYNTAYVSSFAAGGTYTWKVRAFNLFSISQFNPVSTFTIDLTAPPVSTIISPNYGQSVKDTIYLVWSRISTDTRYDSLFFATDSIFSSYLRTQKVYSTSLKINAIVPPLSSSAPGTFYWWKIKSVDSVGNVSPAGDSYKFKLL